MADRTLAQVIQTLATDPLDPVYYLTGEEELLKDEFVTAAIDAAVDPTTRDFNVDIRAAGDLDAEALFALVETPPVLAERRVAVVRNLEQWRKNSKPWRMLHTYLTRPSPTTTLILIHGPGEDPDRAVAQAATHVEIRAPEGDELHEWVAARTRLNGTTIERDAVDLLLDAVGNGLAPVAVELEKLAAADDDGTIAVEDVEALVGVRRGETLSDWVEAALHRNVTRAVELLDVVLPQPGISAVKLVNTLGTALIGTRLARACLDGGKPARAVERDIIDCLRRTRAPGLGRWSVVAAQWAGAAARWTGPELDMAIRHLHHADRQLKSTTLTDPRGTICNMVLRFAATQEAA